MSQNGNPGISDERKKLQQKRLLQPPQFTVLGDQPLLAPDDGTDSFDLSGRVGPIYDILRHPETPTPMAIAIYGDWGAGKTSAMRWLDGQLEIWCERGEAEKKVIVRTAWFYPWKYHTREDVWRGLVAEIIIACIDAKDPSAKAYLSAIKDFGAFLGNAFVSVISGAKLSLGLSEVASLEIEGNSLKEIKEQVQDFVSPENAYLNDFEATFRDWIGKTLGKDERMVVFIDDLDRCLPEVALQVLEALKLYLNIENLVFLVGVDREVVDTLVRRHYRRLGLGPKKSRNYLAKMFSVEVTLAPSDPQIDRFLDALLDGNSAWRELGDLERKIFRDVIRKLAIRSPREVKRLINSSLMAGAGARMSSLADDPAKKAPTNAQGMQVFFVRRILSERYTRSSLVAQNRGTRFFIAWSRILQSGEDVQPTIAVPSSYVEKLQEIKEQPKMLGMAIDDLDTMLSGLPLSYRDLVSDTSFGDLFELLNDADLGELMRLPYPVEAAAISGAVEPGDAAEIVREAVARQCNKAPNHLTESDYKSTIELDLSSQEIEDLDPLKGLTALRRLDLSGTHVSGLDPLKGLTGLETLHLSNTQVSYLDPLKGLTALETLSLSNTQVSDLNPLQGVTALEYLDLSGTQVSDLSPLNGLRALNLLGLRGTQVSDLSPLKGLTALKTLGLRGTQVSDLGPLVGLAALSVLGLRGTQVSDLGPLEGLEALVRVDLRGTQVSDLGPLKGLAALGSLDLEDTQVSDLNPLKGLTALDSLRLSGTQVSDLSPLEGLDTLKSLGLNGTQVSDLSPLKGLKALRAIGLAGSRTTKADVEELREALPNLIDVFWFR